MIHVLQVVSCTGDKNGAKSISMSPGSFMRRLHHRWSLFFFEKKLRFNLQFINFKYSLVIQHGNSKSSNLQKITFLARNRHWVLGFTIAKGWGFTTTAVGENPLGGLHHLPGGRLVSRWIIRSVEVDHGFHYCKPVRVQFQNGMLMHIIIYI